MSYMGFKVVVVRRFRCTQTRPPRIVLFSPSPAHAAVHTPRFRALNVYQINLIKPIACKAMPQAEFVFPN